MGALIAVIVGLLGAAVGIGAALYAMGFFNYLGGKKSSPDAVGKETLVKRLTDLNEPAKPYQIIKGEETDLLAEWKIVDATWYGIFNKSGLNKAYRAYLQLDEGRHSVRCFEEYGSISWSAGTQGLTPSVHFSKRSFGGRILFQKEYGVAYGMKSVNPLEAGEVYQYKFDIDEIRTPLIQAVRAGGWEWVPVTAKRLVTLSNSPAGPVSSGSSAFCYRCGYKLPPGEDFCPKCGGKRS
jgi:hypothetical protein